MAIRGSRLNHLYSDRNAVEGLPLTMIIVMIVLAITIPMIFGSLRAYDRGRVEAAMTSEINDFASMVQLIFISGPGNSAIIDFDAASGSMTGIDYVAFGDEPGAGLASTIRYKLQGQEEFIMLISSPNVPMMSNESEEFRLSSGNYRILAECMTGYLDSNDTKSTYVRLSIHQ